MRYVFVVICMLFWSATPATAQVSIGIGMPGLSIGINQPSYPRLVRVPGYPVYYAPRMDANYFFYDGMYWVYLDDNWYASSWYNGPWALVAPDVVPLYVLRVPVRYYRNPPSYFHGWRAEAPPRWGEHWGDQWAQRRSGWDRWNRRATPAPAPLPVYQRQYSGDRYPHVDQQPVLRSRNYRYQPRDAVVRQQFQAQAVQTQAVPRAPAASQQRRQAPQSVRDAAPGQIRNTQGAQSARQFAPGQIKREQGAQSAREFAPGQIKKEQRGPGPGARPRDDGDDKGRGKGEGRGRGHDK